MENLAYASNNSCSLVQQDNISYLYQTSHVPVIADPLSGPVTGILMLLSTLQYQAPYMNPKYSDAAAQAGKSAYIQVGGQSMQDKTVSVVTNKGTGFAHSIGITDFEMGAVGGAAKIIRTKQINLRGPGLWGIKTTISATPNSGTLGFRYEW